MPNQRLRCFKVIFNFYPYIEVKTYCRYWVLSKFYIRGFSGFGIRLSLFDGSSVGNTKLNIIWKKLGLI